MKSIFGTSLSFLAQLGPKPLFSHKPGGECSKPFYLFFSCSCIAEMIGCWHRSIPPLVENRVHQSSDHSPLRAHCKQNVLKKLFQAWAQHHLIKVTKALKPWKKDCQKTISYFIKSHFSITSKRPLMISYCNGLSVESTISNWVILERVEWVVKYWNCMFTFANIPHRY